MSNDNERQKVSPTQRRVHYGRVNDAYSSLDERNEEYANEITADDMLNDDEHGEREFQENDIDDDSFAWAGWLGLIAAIVSLFWMPIVLGAAAIILGVVSRQRDAEILGNASIVIGAAAIVIRLFIMPFF